jgi:hypothetical protein
MEEYEERRREDAKRDRLIMEVICEDRDCDLWCILGFRGLIHNTFLFSS